MSKIEYFSETAIGGVYEKGVLKNFAKFTRKHLCRSLVDKDSDEGVFLSILRNFEEYLFYITPPRDCFW